MKHIALVVLLLACKKDEPKNEVAPGDVADVDCEKMTTHNVEVVLKDGMAGKPADQIKKATESMAAQHKQLVEACEKEKPTKKLSKKQYACVLAAQTMNELGACVLPQ